MCFSATASFSASAVLLGAGILTLKSTKYRRDWLFAAIPLLFGIQQFIEGVIWLSFDYEALMLNQVMTYSYTFFSHVLWPVYLPLAIVCMEPQSWRRYALFGLIVAGGTVSLYLLYYLVFYPVVSAPIGHHVLYISPHFYQEAVIATYLLSSVFSAFLSTHRMVIVFGVLALLSFIATYYFYTIWFISTWCFFCALLSVVIYFHVKDSAK